MSSSAGGAFAADVTLPCGEVLRKDGTTVPEGLGLGGEISLAIFLFCCLSCLLFLPDFDLTRMASKVCPDSSSSSDLRHSA